MENRSSCNTIAVVSGKGGSGKTMLTATIAKILDKAGYSVLLIDADFGTAGLTYYLALNEVSNISVGLTNLFSKQEKTALQPEKIIEKLNTFNQTDFIAIGDHRRYKKNGESDFFHHYFDDFVNDIKSKNLYDYIIVDCRGGIDDESLTVCKSSDEIIIVAETDTTSFQATQYLVETLYDNGVSNKLSGFFVNKVFDDPSILIRNGVVSFKTTCLSSIPFDLAAIKSFVVGEIPNIHSIYTSQIWHGLKSMKIFQDLPLAPIKKLEPNQFSIFSFKDKNTSLGSYFISFALFLLISSVILNQFTIVKELQAPTYILTICLLLSVAVVSDGIKKKLGKILSRVIALITPK